MFWAGLDQTLGQSSRSTQPEGRIPKGWVDLVKVLLFTLSKLGLPFLIFCCITQTGKQSFVWRDIPWQIGIIIMTIVAHFRAVLESHHAAFSFQLAQKDDRINIFKNLDRLGSFFFLIIIGMKGCCPLIKGIEFVNVWKTPSLGLGWTRP